MAAIIVGCNRFAVEIVCVEYPSSKKPIITQERLKKNESTSIFEIRSQKKLLEANKNKKTKKKLDNFEK